MEKTQDEIVADISFIQQYAEELINFTLHKGLRPSDYAIQKIGSALADIRQAVLHRGKEPLPDYV